MARWRIRETLFAFGDDPPETLPKGLRNFLVVFAFMTWIYRLSLFLAIAALVYHFFIKIVGVMLFIVEMSYFILLPIAREVMMWKRAHSHLVRRRRSLLTGVVALAGVLALALPWHHQISASAMLKASESSGLYIPTGAKLVRQGVTNGQVVSPGAPLFVFESADNAQQEAMVEARIETLDYQLRSISFDAGFREQTSVLRDSLAAAYAERASLQAAERRLTVRAPVAGAVVDVLPNMHPGDYLSPKDRLATIRSESGTVIEAYVTEIELGRIAVGDSATFYPDAVSRPPIHARVVAIDRAATTALDDVELAQVHGGTIEVRGNDVRPVPEAAIYRVRLEPDAMPAPPITLRGVARISGQTESIIAHTVRAAAAVVLREWGS
jgi:putative peptide zinc metalloprotease protein